MESALLRMIYLGDKDAVRIHFGYEEAKAMCGQPLKDVASQLTQNWRQQRKQEAFVEHSPASAALGNGSQGSLMKEVLTAYGPDGLGKRYVDQLLSVDAASPEEQSRTPLFCMEVHSLTQLPTLRDVMTNLRVALLQQQEADFIAARQAHLWCTELATMSIRVAKDDDSKDTDHDRRVFALLHAVGQVPHLTLWLLARLAMSAKRDSDIKVTNAFLTDQQCADVFRCSSCCHASLREV